MLTLCNQKIQEYQNLIRQQNVSHEKSKEERISELNEEIYNEVKKLLYEIKNNKELISEETKNIETGNKRKGITDLRKRIRLLHKDSKQTALDILKLKRKINNL